MSNITTQTTPFACNMNAIGLVNRVRHLNTILKVFRSVQYIQELPNGYAFQLPNDTTLLRKSIEFIANERLCCPFFGFMVEVEPNGGKLWLHLTGQDGVKPFIQAEIGEFLNESVARAIGFH